MTLTLTFALMRGAQNKHLLKSMDTYIFLTFNNLAHNFIIYVDCLFQFLAVQHDYFPKCLRKMIINRNIREDKSLTFN